MFSFVKPRDRCVPNAQSNWWSMCAFPSADARCIIYEPHSYVAFAGFDGCPIMLEKIDHLHPVGRPRKRTAIIHAGPPMALSASYLRSLFTEDGCRSSCGCSLFRSERMRRCSLIRSRIMFASHGLSRRTSGVSFLAGGSFCSGRRFDIAASWSMTLHPSRGVRNQLGGHERVHTELMKRRRI